MAPGMANPPISGNAAAERKPASIGKGGAAGQAAAPDGAAPRPGIFSTTTGGIAGGGAGIGMGGCSGGGTGPPRAGGGGPWVGGLWAGAGGGGQNGRSAR